MSDSKIYPIASEIAAKAHITDEKYRAMYRASIESPETFWAEQADKFLDWDKKWDRVLDWSFDRDDLHVKWFDGGKLNVAYNCIDRHLTERGDKVAIIWEGDDPQESKKITYNELYEQVTRLGDGVAIKLMDSSAISHPGMVAQMKELAKRKKIKYQMEILPRGGTDGGAMQRVHAGLPVVTLSVPTRYVHTSIELADKKDVQGAVNLLTAFIEEGHRADLQLK